MRVLSWNVRSLRDGPRGVAEALRAARPDVVVVQEAPRLRGWRVSRLLLARRSGLRVAGLPWAAGNAVLVAPHVAVLACRPVLLPQHGDLHRRGAVLTRLRVDGAELVVAGTHLDLRAAERLDSARRVRALLGQGPFLLGADVNDEPGSPAWEALADGLQGGSPGPTFPAREPHRRIDALVGTLPLASLEVLDTGRASDHLGVLAEVVLPA